MSDEELKGRVDRAIGAFGIHEDASAYIRSSRPEQGVLVQAFETMDTARAILALNSANPRLPASDVMQLAQAAIHATKAVHELELKGREMQLLDAKGLMFELEKAISERDKAVDNLTRSRREAEHARDLFVGKKTDIYTFSWED